MGRYQETRAAKSRKSCQLIYFRFAPTRTCASGILQNTHFGKVPVIKLRDNEVCSQHNNAVAQRCEIGAGHGRTNAKMERQNEQLV